MIVDSVAYVSSIFTEQKKRPSELMQDRERRKRKFVEEERRGEWWGNTPSQLLP